MDLLTILLMTAGMLAGVAIVGYFLLRMFVGNPFPEFKWGVPL